MVRVEVFVDEAVRGTLPNVCVKTGERADGRYAIEQSWGGVGAGWLLVFLGPLGWIVLALWAATARRDRLTVRLPYSTAAFDRERRLMRERIVTVIVAVALALAAIVQVLSVPRVVWGVGFLGAVVVAAAIQVRLGWSQIGVRLDASRRWVTLSNVHPDFARAVNGTYESDRSGIAR
jgi:hypothetical protein